jgi:hypothetical protein
MLVGFGTESDRVLHCLFIWLNQHVKKIGHDLFDYRVLVFYEINITI